ncbi:MAG: anti-sigma factor, partial [Candidatus Promineifilaceae bacterium]
GQGSRTIPIAGTAQQPAAGGQLIVGPDDRPRLLVVSGLEPLPTEQDYQFWLIGEEAPLGGGTFQVDEEGQGVLEVTAEEPVGAFQAIGVSVEPRGGSAQPTGDIVMLSELAG